MLWEVVSTEMSWARTKGMRMGSVSGAELVGRTQSRGAASARRVLPSGVVANSTSTTSPTGVSPLKRVAADEVGDVESVFVEGGAFGGGDHEVVSRRGFRRR